MQDATMATAPPQTSTPAQNNNTVQHSVPAFGQVTQPSTTPAQHNKNDISNYSANMDQFLAQAKNEIAQAEANTQSFGAAAPTTPPPPSQQLVICNDEGYGSAPSSPTSSPPRMVDVSNWSYEQKCARYHADFSDTHPLDVAVHAQNKIVFLEYQLEQNKIEAAHAQQEAARFEQDRAMVYAQGAQLISEKEELTKKLTDMQAQSDAKESECVKLGREVHVLTNTVAHNLKTHKKWVVDYEKAYEDRYTDLHKRENAAQLREVKCMDLERKSAAQLKTIEELKADVESRKEQYDSLNSNYCEYAATNQDLRKQNSALRQQIECRRVEVESIAELKAQRSKLKADLALREEMCKSWKRACEDETWEARDLKKRVKSLEAAVAEKDAQNKALFEEHANAALARLDSTEVFEKTPVKSCDCETKQSAVQAQNDRLREQNQDFAKKLSGVQQKHADAKRDLDNAKTRITDFEAREPQLNARIQFLKERCTSSDSEIATLKTEVADLETNTSLVFVVVRLNKQLSVARSTLAAIRRRQESAITSPAGPSDDNDDDSDDSASRPDDTKGDAESESASKLGGADNGEGESKDPAPKDNGDVTGARMQSTHDRETIANLENEVSDLQTEINTLSMTLENERTSSAATEGRLNSMINDLTAETNGLTTTLESERAITKSRVDDLNTSISDLTGEETSLSSELEAERTSHRADVAKAEDAVSSQAARIQYLTAERDNVRTSHATLQKELAQSKLQTTELVNQFNTERSNWQSSSFPAAEKTHLQNELQQAHGALANAQTTLSKAEQDKKALTTVRNNLQQRVGELTDENNQLKNSEQGVFDGMQELEKKYNMLDDDFGRLEREYDQMEAAHKASEEMVQRLQDRLDDAQDRLAEADDGEDSKDTIIRGLEGQVELYKSQLQQGADATTAQFGDLYSKQMEVEAMKKDYATLKADYDTLTEMIDRLEKERDDALKHVGSDATEILQKQQELEKELEEASENWGNAEYRLMELQQCFRQKCKEWTGREVTMEEVEGMVAASEDLEMS